MRILFITHNFPPEVNAPASRTYEHCKEWVKRGAEVTVITAAPNFPQGKVYDGYKNKLWQEENIDGIRVIRVWTYIVANKGFVRRTLDFISFSVSSFLAGLFVKTDIIVATSPQFFTALSGRTLHFWKRKPWIMEVRDLWPESIKTVGAMNDNLFIKYFEWEEKRCYKSAKKIVVVTDSFKEILTKRGIDPNKIVVVKNGVSKDLFHPVPKDEALVEEMGLKGKKIIGYIGTHGMAHKLDFVLECAKSLENTDYHFILIGGGARRKELLELKDKLGCKNVTMIPPIPKKEVKKYISILDVSLINLRKKPLFKTVIPSKIFENAAMGIPILMGVEGEAQKLIESYNAGICYEPENKDDFCKKLEKIMEPAIYESCKKGGMRLAEDFDRTHLADILLDVIEDSLKK